MKHPTCLQNNPADNCNILKFTSTCSSCIFWTKLIHRDLVTKVHSEDISEEELKKKKIDVKICWNSHVHIHSGIDLELPGYNSPNIYISILHVVKYSLSKLFLTYNPSLLHIHLFGWIQQYFVHLFHKSEIWTTFSCTVLGHNKHNTLILCRSIRENYIFTTFCI